MKDELAHEVGSHWGDLVDGDRWPYDVPGTHDNFRMTRRSLRAHLRTYVPDPDALAAVNTQEGPAVVALVGDAVYVVKVALLEEGEPPVIGMERFLLDARKQILVLSTLKDGYGTVWRDEEWHFEFADGHKLDISVNGEHVLAAGESDEAKLVRAIANRVGYVPPHDLLAEDAARVAA